VRELLIAYFNGGKIEDKVTTADQLESLYTKIIENIAVTSSTGNASGSDTWRGAELPRGYSDITSQIELQRCELLNVDSKGGGVRVLFESSKPSRQSGEKGTAKDWVESDTDEQLMLFMPFQAMLKLHTLQASPPIPVGHRGR